MEEAKALYLMSNLVRAQYFTHRAIICASCARAPEQDIMQLGYLGTSFTVIGMINAAIANQAFTNLISTYINVIVSVIQGFTFDSGMTAMAIGWLLFIKENPRKHHRLAKVIMLLMQFSCAFALGILLLA